MREKDEVLRALRKCGAVTLILTEGYYVSCLTFSGKLRKHDILVECPNFGFTDDGMLKSLKWGFKEAQRQRFDSGRYSARNVYICDGWGRFTVVGRFFERDLVKALEDV